MKTKPTIFFRSVLVKFYSGCPIATTRTTKNNTVFFLFQWYSLSAHLSFFSVDILDILDIYAVGLLSCSESVLNCKFKTSVMFLLCNIIAVVVIVLLRCQFFFSWLNSLFFFCISFNHRREDDLEQEDIIAVDVHSLSAAWIESDGVGVGVGGDVVMVLFLVLRATHSCDGCWSAIGAWPWMKSPKLNKRVPNNCVEGF